MRFPSLPVLQLEPVFDAHLVKVFQIMEELMGRRVPVLGIALERPVKDFLQLELDGRVGHGGRNGMVE